MVIASLRGVWWNHNVWCTPFQAGRVIKLHLDGCVTWPPTNYTDGLRSGKVNSKETLCHPEYAQTFSRLAHL